jgi:DinB family protein
VADLKRFAIPRVPAVSFGDRAVHGWNPAGYAELLGVTYSGAAQLPPRELARRMDRILESAQALVQRMDAAQLDVIPPERKRSIRDLSFHIFRVGLSFIDTMDQGRMPDTWFEERAPEGMRDGGDVARWGALVRGRITGWFEGARDDEFDRTVQIYYGPQGAHDLLERTTWHCGQHLRQLYILAERLGVKPPAPLPVEAFKGLPLPDAIW